MTETPAEGGAARGGGGGAGVFTKKLSPLALPWLTQAVSARPHGTGSDRFHQRRVQGNVMVDQLKREGSETDRHSSGNETEPKRDRNGTPKRNGTDQQQRNDSKREKHNKNDAERNEAKNETKRTKDKAKNKDVRKVHE